MPKGKPFVLQLCFSDPHRPLDRRTRSRSRTTRRSSTLPPHYPDTKLVREDFARYYDEIARFDGDVGTVLAELEERGLAGNTIVVFMGDNGASQFRGKGTLNEFGIHVPLIVRWPGAVKPGIATARARSPARTSRRRSSQAAGVDVPAEMTGRSFLPLLQGRDVRGARSTSSPSAGRTARGCRPTRPAFDLGRVIVIGTHKLIYNATVADPVPPGRLRRRRDLEGAQQMNKDGKLSPELSKLYFSPTRPMFELYDLKADPDEMKNLAGTPDGKESRQELKGGWRSG